MAYGDNKDYLAEQRQAQITTRQGSNYEFIKETAQAVSFVHQLTACSILLIANNRILPKLEAKHEDINGKWHLKLDIGVLQNISAGSPLCLLYV